MKKKAFRFLAIVVAMLAGVGVTTALTYAGDKAHGPVEKALVKAGTLVHSAEKVIILEQRSIKRSDKLKWLAPYKDNTSLLKHPKMILTGAYDNQTTESYQSVVDLENKLHSTFPIIHIYSAWGSKPEEQFPKLQVESILELGSIPMITWEPWLTDFDAVAYPALRKVEERDKGGMADVAKGAYDTYIKQWANDVKDIKQPVFIRVGHEMNDPYRYPWGPQNNTAAEFTAAWKHVHDVFIQAGATNVIWVWSPHPAYGYFKDYYPGDAYVDYVGAGVLNYGTVASWSKWWTFDEIFGKHYAELSAFSKPIMITEFGCLNVGGNRAQWFSDALKNMPLQYPAVKSVVYFHYSDDRTTTQQNLNWYFKNDELVTKTIIKAVQQWPDSVKATQK